MKLTLLNKNTPIVDIAFHVRRGYISDIIAVHNPEYAPLGLVDENKVLHAEGLADWWEERAIPDRANVSKVLEHIQMDKQELIVKSLGLSLSDQYWVKPVGADIQWKDVNFFTNAFSLELGELFFCQTGMKHSSELQYASPDLTSNGFLDKRWIISETGEQLLCKSGFDTWRQQPYNEKIASDILTRLGCENFVVYTLKNAEEPYCLCKNFVTETTEYIPGNVLRKLSKKEQGETEYAYFMRCCERFQLAERMQAFLDYVLPFDYLIGNEDRNYGNFGIIRNVETLKIEKMAPIFDNGNSLWYRDALLSQDLRAYPFAFRQEEQISLVSDARKFPLHRLGDIASLCERTLRRNKRLSADRVARVVQAVAERRKLLEMKLASLR